MRVFPAIHNWQMQPPAGGWSVTVELQGEKRTIQGHTPMQVLANLLAFAKTIDFPMRDFEAEDILNNDWKRRDPGRALGAVPGEPGPKPPEPRHSHLVQGRPNYHGPSRWGPSAWLWLNTFGMRGAWDKALWDSAIDRVTFLLNPARSPGTGCPDCFQEWLLICKKNDPKTIETQELAMRFLFNAHNEVNRKLGKKQPTWKEAVYNNGWYIVP